MSELLGNIRTDLVTARKSGDTVTSNVLRTVIAECEKRAKGTSGQQAREMTDVDVLGIVSKLSKDIAETKTLLQDKPDRVAEIAKLETETDVLAKYLPKQLTDDELRGIIQSMVDSGADMGVIMKTLKSEHHGTYDAKLAAGIIKQATSPAVSKG